MRLTEREYELGELASRAAAARAGRGGAVLVSGESGAGKTAFVEAFLDRHTEGEQVLWGACDPLSTPRPLGPLHDLADRFDDATRALLRGGDQSYDIFAAVFGALRPQPSILIVDDLHWADQGTIDLFRFLLRRVARTPLLLIGIARDDEVGAAHPLRGLLGDIARSAHACTLTVPPLSLDAVTTLIADRPVDPRRLHEVTGGNAFFVCEMLDHRTDELPATVRDAILARTAGLDTAAWDLLHLLSCAPGAIADHLLIDLGVTLPALRALDDAGLIKRNDRGVAFRHDLCRLAVTSVIPPGAEPGLHRRFIHAHYAAARPDPAVITHHAVGAGDSDLIAEAAAAAGRAGARSGAHTQAAEFFRLALDQHQLPPETEAELLELLAAEYYLTDRLDDAITACRTAMRLREAMNAPVAVSADHHALAVYQWYNSNRELADEHVSAAISALDGAAADLATLTQVGHAFALQAYLAVQSTRLEAATALLARAPRDRDRRRRSAAAGAGRDRGEHSRGRLRPDRRPHRTVAHPGHRPAAHRRDLFQRLHEPVLFRCGTAAARPGGRAARGVPAADGRARSARMPCGATGFTRPAQTAHRRLARRAGGRGRGAGGRRCTAGPGLAAVDPRGGGAAARRRRRR
ncbi:AAA family ATPase [Nocardia sp. NPDC057668]|uniref:AAA family ATPase n=1 Tax=Nocardia sp. NPDC057668 TaxID=3346202 RepID=UPI00366CA408